MLLDNGCRGVGGSRTANRRAGSTPLLRVLIREAAFWRCEASAPPLDEALADPAVGRYVDNFGRPGDTGVIAVLDRVGP
jgi:hypothetical protein